MNELREGNKELEGKIEQQSKTKKILKELLIQQIKSQNRKLTPREQRVVDEIDFIDLSDDENDSE